MDTSISNAIILHCKDSSLIPFTPCSKGLYHYTLQDHESLSNFWSMISTVAGNAQKFIQQQYKHAILARRVQNIIMRPGSQEFMDVSITHMRNCPINKQHIQMADNIFGPNLGSLKGKTTYHAPAHVHGHITLVPHDILAAHSNIHLSVDIMFVNKIPSLPTHDPFALPRLNSWIIVKFQPFAKNSKVFSIFTIIVVLPSPNYMPILSLNHLILGYPASTPAVPTTTSLTLNASSAP